MELTDNSTSFLTFAGICAKLDDITPSTANLVLTGTPPGVQLTGSLSLAFDMTNPLNGTAVLCGDLDSITSRDGDGEPEGGLGNLGIIAPPERKYSVWIGGSILSGF